MLGLLFCARAFSSCGKRGPLFIAVRRLLLLRSTGSRRAGSVVVAHGPSCSAACGIFPDQGSNPCTLRWQADSQPLRHEGSPLVSFLKTKYYMYCSPQWIPFLSSRSFWPWLLTYLMPSYLLAHTHSFHFIPLYFGMQLRGMQKKPWPLT